MAKYKVSENINGAFNIYRYNTVLDVYTYLGTLSTLAEAEGKIQKWLKEEKTRVKDKELKVGGIEKVYQ